MGNLWGSLMRLRRNAYKHGFFKSQKAPLPIISVGNITVGGNGKTPMCLYLADKLHALGYQTAILSRGYGRKKQSRDPILVSRGQGPLVPWELSGDEPLLLAKESPGFIIVSKNRLIGAKLAWEMGADLAILDDGFQHLSLQNDVNILMLKADNHLGNGYVLPAGPLREPPEALEDADLTVAVGHPASALRHFHPIFYAQLLAQRFRDLASGEFYALDFLQNRRFAAFCGLGQPFRFKESLLNLSLTPVAFQAYPDHFVYQKKDLQFLRNLYHFCKLDYLVTTSKDAVKLEGLRVPTLILEARFELDNPELFLETILSHLKLSPPKAPSDEAPPQRRPPIQ
ncbi:MAG: tetraacyldisaccharide 4'-kinase [Deltaproteobacteria bacterium]|nr:tetraacyldisaccharide 4'-kinase [Deltaproteobacteria bacterium]